MDEIFAQMLLVAEEPLEIAEIAKMIVDTSFCKNIDDTPDIIANRVINNSVDDKSKRLVLNSMNDSIKEVKKIKKPRNTVKPKNKHIEVDDFDKTMNILDFDMRTKFINEVVTENTQYLTAPILTTAPISGTYANIKMLEEDWIKYMVASRHLLAFRCNYGEVIYDKYTPPIRKEKKKKIERKMQGDGTEFNSQITIFVNIEHYLYTDDDIIPTSAPIFKFKLFRNGRLQLPGGNIRIANNVVEATKLIEAYCNRIFNANETELHKLIMIVNVNICMKNYKFIIIMSETQITNLFKLKELFTELRNKQIIDNAKNELTDLAIMLNNDILIHDIVPNGSLTNLSIVFKTPVYGNPDKTMRMTIEKSGKVNIKGALYVEYSAQSFHLLNRLLATYKDTVVHTYKANFGEYNVPEKSKYGDNYIKMRSNLLGI